MTNKTGVFSRIFKHIKGWEGLLLTLLIIIFLVNSYIAPNYLTMGNQINLFILSIEKIIVALIMAFLIINGEIDLSIPSIMGMCACAMGYYYGRGMDMGLAIGISLVLGLAAGIFNGFWIALVGLNSLIVTLAMLISYRGIARVYLENKSIGQFPEWFNFIGQKKLIGPFPLSLILFFVLFLIALVILQYTGFGRRIFVIGNNKDAALYSGVKVRRVKYTLYVASGLISAIAGTLLAARFGAVRGDLANGYELDVITMALLGGVSIFGGSGSLYGVFLSILIILNLRNGMSLLSLSGHFQNGVISILLILSVLGPNLANRFLDWNKRRKAIIQSMKISEEN
jgi:rhamnose transport system permease protein